MAKKRPGQFSDNEVALARKQKTAESRDNEGEEESDTGMDVVEHHTEVQQELPSERQLPLKPSTGQLSSVRVSEMIVDKWAPEEQSVLDADITKSFKMPTGGQYQDIVLTGVLKLIAERNKKEISLDEATVLIQNNGWLRKHLIACWEAGSFRDIRRLKILQAPSSRSLPALDIARSGPATIDAWKGEFKGDAAETLLDTISVYLAQDRLYSYHASILNSSGTGKSRLVDELSKTIITVPICLRPAGSHGYPPPDKGLRAWFEALRNTSSDQKETAERLRAFLYSLLRVTLEKLELLDESADIPSGPKPHKSQVKERQRKLALSFRRHMTEAEQPQFEETNEYRTSFFKEVIAQANRISTSTQTEVSRVGKEIGNFMDESNVLFKKTKEGKKRPLLILAFDEAHGLTDVPNNQGWSLFSELRRCLTGLKSVPIFILFLSTAGKFQLFSPPRSLDYSSRITRGANWVLPPITETGFDQFALTAKEGEITLDRVVEDEWICRLGRPLFASRYIASNQTDRDEVTMVQFAIQKLLGGVNDLKDPMSADYLDRTLACLSVRVPLEFNFSNSNARDIVCRQIERHMRLCTIATSGCDLLFTTTGSEPLLAEAAFEVVNQSTKSPIYHLSNHLDTNCVNYGERGELVAALLVMQARDAVASETESRWVSVGDFMKKLLGDSAAHIDSALPSFARPGEGRNSLADTFADSRIWFNHVLKVRNMNLINVRYLWRFITRGAMILCANCQRGVDLVVPICYSGNLLSRRTVTAILIQVKNDMHFGQKIHGNFFDAMEPFNIGLFENRASLPIIRMVFALASRKPAAKYNVSERSSPRINKSDKSDPFTSYDIWCAGISPKTFPFIKDDTVAYQKLLDRTCFPGHEYDVSTNHELKYPNDVAKKKGDLLRLFNPLLEDRNEHQLHFIEEGAEGGTTAAPAA